MALSLQTVFQVLTPKRLPNPKGTANSPTFDPANNANVLSAPQYREHLEDIFTTRASSDSRDLIRNLLVQDPDASASLNAFLTLSDTKPIILVKDINGAIDRNGLKILNALIDSLTTRYDYSKGFEYTPDLRAIAEEMRYMILAEGMVMGEPIVTKEGIFNKVRLIKTNDLEWFERENGRLVPEQVPSNGGDNISLDFPHIFVAYYRQDPSKAYAYSPFVSVINTAAARQRIINDLYRIMQLTGYPRMDIAIMEDVIRANAPESIKSDTAKMATYITQTIGSISTAIANLRPDQAFVHTDAVEVGIVNEGKSGMTLNIEPVIKTLNAQNQAALKTMATILGRGEAGVNTASVEARLFALQCDGLNVPVALLMSQMFTFLLRLTGSNSRVEVSFTPAEMRSPIELEAQLNLMAARLLYDLSEGIIDDDEYHLRMYGRLRPDSSPILSGTKFYNASGSNDVNGNDQKDPIAQSVKSKDDKSAKSNAVKK